MPHSLLLHRAALIPIAVVAALTLVGGCSKGEREYPLTIVVTNNMHGEVRSCGCGAMDYGGLGRRATYMDGVRRLAENFLLFEGGDFMGTGINYSAQKARLTTEAMAFIGYDGIVVGEKDFAEGVDNLTERARSLDLPIVAANLFDTQTDALVFPASLRFKRPNGLRVGVIGVLGEQLVFPEGAPPERLRVGDPKAAIEGELARIRPEVDLVVLLAHMPTAAARRLVGQIDGIDLVVNGHDARPSRKPLKAGEAYMVSTVERGRFMAITWAMLDPEAGLTDVASEQQPLGVEYADHKAIVSMFESYDMEIARFEKDRKPVAGGQSKQLFAGAESCGDCHEAINAHWAETLHAHAFQILLDEGREFDRDCTPCHTTGFGKPGGFVSLAQTPGLVNVQCETCHGNSAGHAEAPERPTPGDATAVCASCHTAEQTPDFDFEKYWSKIAHP